ncbi:MAG: hypothetical protein LBC27_04680 [Spirochaetaceae bacterium]|jgi:hypothetical protein|nr:hypothetical protein [Spirochaetaceae bacterium]
MNDNPFSFVTFIINLIKTSVMARIIFVIILLLIILMVILPLVLKLRRKHIKTKETQSLVRDLMVWRHVAQLAQGGESQVKAKKDLSDNILRIDELLNQGFELAVAHNRGLYGIPWFMLLGEPHSGKSSLLKESELDMIPSAVEQEAGPEIETKSLPVRMWLGGKAVLCEVSGAVFFDRWLGGSSAEWAHIVNGFCRRHYRMPLNGVILTIPADALLADSGDLTRKKALLMANELAYLLNSSGMRLPCYIVVTKLDAVEGFREYVIGLSGELRHQILGFDNDSLFYEPKKFKERWDALLERLRSGYKKNILSRDMIMRLYNTPNRMDLTGKTYLFPENFAAMYDNLHIYLDMLFSEDNFHGTKETIFDGLFFASATDKGVSFSPAIAALAGKSADDFMIREEKPAKPQSYFIRSMLQNFIFNPSPYAGFVRKKEISRSIPIFAMCGIIITFGIVFFLTAVIRGGDLKISLSQVANYYTSLAASMRNGSAGENPVIIENESGQYVINNQPVADLNGVSPVQFYNTALSYRDIKLVPGMGFYLSGMLVFFENNMGWRDRLFITNTLYDPLIRTPLIKSVGRKLVEQKNAPPPLDNELRSVIQSFIMLDEGKNYNFGKLFQSKQYSSETMIKYIMPGISNDSRILLDSNRRIVGKDRAFTTELAYIYSNDFFQAKVAAIEIMLSDWQTFSVYPDSLYGKLKSLVGISQNIVTNYSRIEFLSSMADNADTLREVQNMTSQWKDLIQTRNKLISQGVEIFQSITEQTGNLGIPVGALSSDVISDPFGNNLINDYIFNDLLVRYAVEEFTGLFQKDMDFVRMNNDVIDSLAFGSINSLEKDFSVNLEKEITNLRLSAQSLKTNELLSTKLTNDADAPSFFNTVEEILNMADAINIPDMKTIKNVEELNWTNGQYDIINAFNNFENYVKPIADNEKVSNLINNSRIMLAAEAYLNRYIILNAQYNFLSTSPDVITAMISSRAGDEMSDIFSLSGRAIQSALGAMPFNNGYDPVIVKNLVDGIAAYNDMFSKDINLKTMPGFLKNHDMSIYQTDAFSAYMDRYINYWGNYPDNSYTPVLDWQDYRMRVNQNKPYQINSVLQTLYSECIGILNDINDIVLTSVLQEQKAANITMLNDKIKLLSSFMSADADRMLSAWNKLPPDSEQAFMQLRSLPPDEMKNTYMTVYSDARNISIGWWNDFILDGVNILSKTFCDRRLNEFSEKFESFKAFPLMSDAPKDKSLTIDDLNDIATLLGDMGAALLPLKPSDIYDPLTPLVHPVLFKDSTACDWAQSIYQIAAAASTLKWALIQPPMNIQNNLSINERLLAINRFRYLEISTTGKAPELFNTYTDEEITLASGIAPDKGINLKFYMSSADKRPQAVVNVDTPWSIFDFYLNEDVTTTDAGSFFPVFISDDLGQYVYFMAIKFSNNIPQPDNWYSSSTWPNLKVVDRMVDAAPR